MRCDAVREDVLLYFTIPLPVFFHRNKYITAAHSGESRNPGRKNTGSRLSPG